MTELRPERPGDVDAIRTLLTAAFDGASEAVLVDALRDGPAWLPGLSVVAVHDRAVIGYALLSRVVIAAGTDQPALALGPVAVRPDRQRGGVGTALVTDALHRAAGESAIVVLGDPAFYRRFGFVPGAELGVTSEWSSFADAWQVLALRDGVRAGEVVYPAAWRAL